MQFSRHSIAAVFVFLTVGNAIVPTKAAAADSDTPAVVTAFAPQETLSSSGGPAETGNGCIFPCCHCFCQERILGVLPSDQCFDRFISPISNPFFFEDPRSLTEVRGIYLNDQLPGAIGGAHIQVWSGQLRARISDRWSIIAPRLGDVQLHPGGPGSPSGFLSAPVGVKYNLFRDSDRQLIVSGGLTYFIPGANSAFSGFGDGDFHLFLTGGKQILDRGHWLSGTGFRIPANSDYGTQLWYWSNQWDYEVLDRWYGLVGLNWFHFMKNAGNNFTGGVNGLDLINLPTSGVAGTNVVTGVIGGKWKPSGHLEVGCGYEFPLSSRTDILNNRIYADVIFRF